MKAFVVFLDDFESVRPELVKAINRRGLGMEHISVRWFLNQEGYEFRNDVYEFIVSATPANLHPLFKALDRLSRFSHARIVVHPLASLPGSTVLDLQDRGCLVLPPVPTAEQLFQLFQMADASDQRYARRGVGMQMCGGGDPYLIGPYGGSAIYFLGKGKQRPMFFRLVEFIGFEVSLSDLANAAGCEDEEVRTYVMRLRDRYDQSRTKLRVKVSKLHFLEETGRGYQLNARIVRRPLY